MPTSTPWGPAQSTKKYAHGVNLYSCAGHGGFKVSPKKNESVHPALRRADGWYEEDCDWARVVLAFTELFTQDQCNTAHGIMKNYFPDDYEEWFRFITGNPSYEIPLAESRAKRERAFRAENLDKYQAVSANNCGSKNGVPMVKCFAVRGGRNESGQYASEDRAYFVVTAAEYETRGGHCFVIDESKHPRETTDC